MYNDRASDCGARHTHLPQHGDRALVARPPTNHMTQNLENLPTPQTRSLPGFQRQSSRCALAWPGTGPTPKHKTEKTQSLALSCKAACPSNTADVPLASRPDRSHRKYPGLTMRYGHDPPAASLGCPKAKSDAGLPSQCPGRLCRRARLMTQLRDPHERSSCRRAYPGNMLLRGPGHECGCARARAAQTPNMWLSFSCTAGCSSAMNCSHRPACRVAEAP